MTDENDYFIYESREINIASGKSLYINGKLVLNGSPFDPVASSNKIVFSGSSGSALAAAAGVYIPVPCGPGRIIGVLVEVITTPGGPGSVIRAGIHDTNPDVSEPFNRLSDGTVSGTTNGLKEIACDVNWPGGVTWILVAGQGSPSPQPTLRITSSPLVGAAIPSGISTLQSSFLQASNPAGALPATAGINALPVAIGPAVGLRFA